MAEEKHPKPSVAPALKGGQDKNPMLSQKRKKAKKVSRGK